MTALVGLGDATRAYNPFKDPYHPVHIKDPNAILDYPCDWSNSLVLGDFIVAVEFDLDSGLYMPVKPGMTDICGVPYIGGGSPGLEYTVVCRMTTDQGRQDTRRFMISIQTT